LSGPSQEQVVPMNDDDLFGPEITQESSIPDEMREDIGKLYILRNYSTEQHS
jgi:hypothetical protein